MYRRSQERNNIVDNMNMEVAAASVVQWSEFLATAPEISGLIPGATRFSEK
jgi:hypothetical protein